MTPEIHAVIYVSNSTGSIHDAAANTMIQDILTKSRTNNPRLGITGALLFTDGYFAQVLEGEKSVVETLFEKIRSDPRHSDITVLSFRANAHRRFPEWSMAYAGLAAAPAWMSKPELLTNPSAVDGDVSGQQLIEFMVELIRDQ